MKNIFIIIITLFFAITSCKNKATETKAETSTKDTTATKEEPTVTEVELTDDQIKAIDLETGSIEQRNLKSTIKVNGKGSHGSQPWGGVDPIAASAQIVEGLQHIVSRQSDLTKATLEDLLKDCKPTDYITVEHTVDYDDCFDGYWVSVMRLVKEDDSAYYQTILDDYNYLRNQNNVAKVKLKAKVLGLDLTEYQVNELAKVFKEYE